MPRIVAEKTKWIEIGFKLFSENGIAGVIVDKMAKRLKCNRSSFYWHFSSKKEFIYDIIDYWIKTDTDQIISLAEKSGSPKEKFKTLIQVVFKEDPYIDFIFHLKRLARKQPEVQVLVDQIDDQRIKYVSSILTELGYSSGESNSKAGLFYKYLIGYHEMIRYKKQSKNYVEDVYQELKHFINL